MTVTLTRRQPSPPARGGPPRGRAGDPPRDRPGVGAAYLLAATGFLALVAVLALRNNIISDFGQHASAVERIKADPWHPANPLLDLPGTDSPYYSPLIVALGLLARATGWSGRAVLRGCGVLNLALFVTGVAAFARTLSRDRAAPLMALAATTLLWGIRPAAWSGFLSAGAMTRNIDFPSAFAIGLTLHLWAATGRAASTRRPYAVHLLIGLGMAMIVLIHPITSVGAAVGVAALVAGRQEGWDRAAAARWAATVAVAAAVMAAWPYYDVFSLVGDDTVDPFQKILYGRHLVTWYGLALAGVPALAARWRRHRLDPLALMWLADLAVAAYGWFSGHYTYGRIFGVLLFPPQFALAVELARPGRWSARRRALAAVAALAACLGLVVQTAAVVRVPYRVPLSPTHLTRLTYLAHWPDYRWAASRLRVGDVVLTDDYQAEHVLPAYGVFLVCGAWPDPSLSAALRHGRAIAVRRYFAPGASAAEQRAIAARYHVGWVFLAPGEPLPAGARLVAVAPDGGQRLARLGADRPAP